MAEKILNVRIANRYDSYTNWTANDTQILKKGEIAFITVEAADGQTQSPPAVLCKVGDGVSQLKDLQFLQGIASDVYAWAKASTPPAVNASDVVGLEDFITGAVEDTDTQYRITTTDNITYALQSTKTPDVEESWTTVSTFKATTVEAGTSSGNIKVNGVDMKITGWDTLSEQVTTNKEAIDTLNGDSTVTGSVDNKVKKATDELRNTLEGEISSKIASVYKPAGSITPIADPDVADKKIIDSSLLNEANVGKVYNVTGSFTTTENFVEGEGRTVQAGANIVVINTGTEDALVLKFDVLMGIVDLSIYSTTTEMNQAIQDAIENAPAKEITTDKITDFNQKVTEVINTEISKELGEGETSELQTTIKGVAGEAFNEKVVDLKNNDAEVANEFVTEVKETNGIVTVKRTGITLDQLNDVAEGNTVIFNCGSATV